MNQSDAYYRALLAYRAQTAAKRECVRDRNAFAEAGGHGEIAVTRAVCTVDEEWIKEIEAGLVHIEKAIKEERQFIYSNGEVIPIEKVKNVSKDSVEHLARHSDLITRVHEGEDLIPDKLYTVERLSDYAVYENRFLYMLLCYLRDFVTIRYQKILDMTNRYTGSLNIDREVATFGRLVTMKIELREERRDDPYLREHNPAKSLIDRMDLILKTILAFLATPLMESAGKAAMLKPPITKTNVLKMDNNFKGAVALYDYIIAYEGDGYTVTEDIHSIDPFGDELAEDMAEAELLLSFLTYRYGLDLGPTLKAAFEKDEAERRLVELKQRTEQLETLRRRMERSEISSEEYILQLEKQVRALQHEADRIGVLINELEEHKQNEIELGNEVATLLARIAELEEQNKQAEIAHSEALFEAEQIYIQDKNAILETKNAIIDMHAIEMNALKEAHEEEKAALAQEHATALANLEQEHVAEVTALLDTHNAERASWEEQMETTREEHREEVEGLQQTIDEKQGELDQLTAAYDELTEEKLQVEARLVGQKAIKGSMTPEELEKLTSKEEFDQLERELVAFVHLYEQVWKKTKRKIRKELLNIKYIKGQSGKK